MTDTFVLWRRLDAPGHDACRLDRSADGWRLEGTAVYHHDGVPARLDYRVECGPDWVSRRGRVSGWLGARSIELVIERSAAGVWRLGDAVVTGLADCVDLDFGFTPATNLTQLRRVALAQGRAADVPAAWLDVSEGTLARLAQRYERRSETTYRYESPRHGYTALLEVTPAGFVRRYPELWEMEP
jgi:hypothetical protein